MEEIRKQIESSNIPFTAEEEAVFYLPKEKQEAAWLDLLKNCDFSKTTILRIGAMLKPDGLLPFAVFSTYGIEISKTTANVASEILKEHGFVGLHESTFNKLVEVKGKILKGITLTEDELIYKDLLDKYDSSEKDTNISFKCAIRTHDYFVDLLYTKGQSDKNIYCDYLVNRIIMLISMGGVLASGDREFISDFFKEYSV